MLLMSTEMITHQFEIFILIALQLVSVKLQLQFHMD
jgi:hypothetical protein